MSAITCSIILPTLNEEGNIGPLIERIRATLGADCEIIVVDDDSTDSTRELVRQAELIHRIDRKGLASAIQTGIDRAQGELIGWLDADLSHPPELLAEMKTRIDSQECDCVIASRFHPGSEDHNASQNDLLRIHKILSRILSIAGRILVHPGVADYSSGFILLRKSCLTGYRLKGDHGEYFIDLIRHLLVRHAFKVVELPYESPRRISGESKTAVTYGGLFRRGWKYLAMFADGQGS